MSLQDLMLIIPAAVTAYVICYVSMPAIIKMAELKNLIDTPDGNRKLRDKTIPTLGGIGIFSAFIISYSVWGQAVNMEAFPFFVASMFILFLMGVRDDIIELKALTKLLVQIVAVLVLVYGGDVRIAGFGGLLGIGEIPAAVASIATVVILLALINAYNLIDGIDGLAGGVGTIVCFIFGIWFWGAGFLSYALLSFSLAGALIGFLAFNLYPAKIFMGDTGAMSVGFVLGFLSVEFLALNEMVAGNAWHIRNGEVFAVSILILPIVDTLRVIAIRLKRGERLFKADRNHIHHRILDMGVSHRQAALILCLFNGVIFGLAYITMPLDINLQLPIVIGTGMLIVPFVRLAVFFSRKVFNLRVHNSKSDSAGAAYDTN